MKYLDLKPEAKKRVLEILNNEYSYFSWRANKIDMLMADILRSRNIKPDEDGQLMFDLYGVKMFHVFADWSMVQAIVQIYDKPKGEHEIFVEVVRNRCHTQPEVKLDVKNCTPWFAANELRDIIDAQANAVDEIMHTVRNFDELFLNDYCEDNNLDFTEDGFINEREEA